MLQKSPELTSVSSSLVQAVQSVNDWLETASQILKTPGLMVTDATDRMKDRVEILKVL